MKATVTTNVDDLNKFINGLADTLNLGQQDFANDLLDEISARIHNRFVAQRGADAGFTANRGDYGKRKRRLGIPVGIGIRGGSSSGEMAEFENFLGQRILTRDQAFLNFGANDDDRRKGMWFENGARKSADGTESSGAKGQPPRPFFELNDADIDLIVERLEEQFIRKAGGGP